MKLQQLITLHEKMEALPRQEVDKSAVGKESEGVKQTKTGYAWKDPDTGRKWWFFQRAWKNEDTGKTKGPYWYAKTRLKSEDGGEIAIPRPSWASPDKEGKNTELRASDFGGVVETSVKDQNLPFTIPHDLAKEPVVSKT